MPENNVNSYKRGLYVAIGVFLWLLAMVLIINIGPVAKVLSFIFTYTFGILSYVIYVLMLVVGFFLIFFQDKVKVSYPSRVVASIVLFLGLDIIVTDIYVSVLDTSSLITLSNFTQYFSDSCFSSVKYIRTTEFINLFSVDTPFAGGYLGYFIVALLTNVGGYVVSSLLIVLGVLLYFVPNLRKLIRRNSEVSPEGEDIEIDDKSLKKEKTKRVRVSNVNVVKEASEVEEEEISYIPTQGEGVLLKHAYYDDGSAPLHEQRGGFSTADVPFMDKKSLPVLSEEIDSPKEIEPEILKPQYKEPEPVREQIYVDTTSKKEEPINLEEEQDLFVSYDDEEFEQEDIEEEKIAAVESLSNFKESEPEPIQEAPNNVFIPSSQKEEEVPVVNEEPKNELETPAKKRINYIPPSLDLLKDRLSSFADSGNIQMSESRAHIIDEKMKEFRTDAHVASYVIGPTVTRFNIAYGQNVSYTKVENLIDDLSIALNGVSCRFVKTVLGTPYSGIEIPNENKTTVGFKEILKKLPDPKEHPLAVGFGVNVDGQTIWADYDQFPHAIIAGTTGSGKTVFVESIIATLIMRNSPDDVKIMIVDPKFVDLTKFDGIPHLLCPIIADYSQVNVAFKKLIEEMNRRYEVFRNARVGDIKTFNKYARANNLETMPSIFVFIDEFADLVGEIKEITNLCQRLAQKSRAAGIYLCIATQRPDKNVVTGNLKANLPTHIALRTSNVTDSITILGEKGANYLQGKGDMLVQTPDVNQGDSTRLQGCFLDDDEIFGIVNYLKENYKPDYDPNFLDLVDHSEEAADEVVKAGVYGSSNDLDADGKYSAIKEWVMGLDYVSMSRIQVEWSIGFSRARRIFNQLVSEGIIEQTSATSNKGSKVLIHEEEVDYEVDSEEVLY
ncbi:MAG: hypothetical protein LUD22_00625 [Coprobacillus sp.]|nr:hypothetical protein [Coprobacillus sp.]